MQPDLIIMEPVGRKLRWPGSLFTSEKSVNRGKSFILLLIYLISSLPGYFEIEAGAQLIPADRRINWSKPGVAGGIPHRTIIFRTVDQAIYGDSKTDATAEIQNALNACPDGQVIYIPEGRYKILNTLNIKSYITLRGDGQGKTVLVFEGGGRSAIRMDAGVYNQIKNSQNIIDLTGSLGKGASLIRVNNIRNLGEGDILEIDQLNDGKLVDVNGAEGYCSYCGRSNGTRTLGQLVQIIAINTPDNTVTINRPLNFTYSASLVPQAVLIPGANIVQMAGIEDLTITQPSAFFTYLVEMQGTENCWLRNVEIKNIDWRAVWLLYGLQNEIRECYIHNSCNGYGRSHGYGVYLDLFSSANLVENNVFKTIDGGGIMAGSGASGNVIAYNIIADHRFDDYRWVNGSPSLNHNPHPMMNLWEGNVGDKLEGDFIHGSSSHNTIFRSRSYGWQNDSAINANAAIALAKKNLYYNVLGCILGTDGKSNRYEVDAGQKWNTTDRAIWLLGVTCEVKDSNVLATLLRHGNYDYFTHSVKWDSTIKDHNLPASLYLQQAPFFFGKVPWPAIGPDVQNYFNKIPAERWMEQFADNRYNTAPVAMNQEISTRMNTIVAIKPEATDLQNDQLRYFLVKQEAEGPRHGSLYWDEDGLVYKPEPGFYGIDSIAFLASDGRLKSNIAKIIIQVNN